MAGPAQVNFPGQKQRMRMRGTKQASGDVKQRLHRNLTRLLEEPDSLLPEYRGTKRVRWGRISPVHRTLEDIRNVISNRFDKKWLARRMMSKRADVVAKAWAGSILAAQEEQHTTVSTFNHPLFGAASYVRRGDARASVFAGIQNQQNPRLRLLPWEEHAKRGWWFFSWRGGFYCSGQRPEVEDEWILDVMARTKLRFDIEGRVLASPGIPIEAVADGDAGGAGYMRMEFNNGFVICMDSAALEAERKEPVIMQLALSVLPPKLDEFTTAEFIWRPEGWEGELPEASRDGALSIVNAWLGLTTPEKSVASRCRDAILEGIDHGFIIASRWFSTDDRADFIDALSGSDIERRAAVTLLDMIDGEGMHVDLDGGVGWTNAGGAVRLESDSLHLLLTATWEQYGTELLQEMFELDEDGAQRAQEAQARKRGAFGNFLRKLEQSTARQRVLTGFPWYEVEMEGPCGAAHQLVMCARSESVGKSCSQAAKLRGGVHVEAAAWGWLLVHDKAAGKEWKFDPAARELGSDWTVALDDLWKGSADVTEADGATYIEAMRAFHRASGTQVELPDPG